MVAGRQGQNNKNVHLINCLNDLQNICICRHERARLRAESRRGHSNAVPGSLTPPLAGVKVGSSTCSPFVWAFLDQRCSSYRFSCECTFVSSGGDRQAGLPSLPALVLRRPKRDRSSVRRPRLPGGPRHAGARRPQDPARHSPAHHAHQE